MSGSGAFTLEESTNASEPPSRSAAPISRASRTAPRKTDSKAARPLLVGRSPVTGPWAARRR